MDAVKLLVEDHERARDLMQRMLATGAEQVDLRRQLLALLYQELEVHARIEEDVFYPALDRVGQHEQIQDSRKEHQQIRQMLAGIENTDLSDPAWKAQVQVLYDCVVHHVGEEEDQLFPWAQSRLGSDLDDLGTRMSRERGDLLRDF